MECPFESPVCDGESDLCFRCEEIAHAEKHPRMDDPDCPTCRLRSLQFGPSCHPSTRNNIAPRVQNNSWERGIVTDERGLPYRDGNGSPIGVKQFADNRSKFESQIRANRQGSLV